MPDIIIKEIGEKCIQIEFIDGIGALCSFVFACQEDFIKWLFHKRCIGLDKPCANPGTEINEIIPRSSGKESMEWKHRVPMCNPCHSEYHRRGTSQRAIQKLQERRKDFLENNGKGEFV